MPIGVDTGFFFALQECHPVAIDSWKNDEIITCTLVLFEIQRKLLKGEFEQWDSIVNDIEDSLEIIPVTPGIAKKASYLSWGTGITAMDALILSSLLDVGCTAIYTRDSHFELYKKNDIRIINLNKIK